VHSHFQRPLATNISCFKSSAALFQDEEKSELANHQFQEWLELESRSFAQLASAGVIEGRVMPAHDVPAAIVAVQICCHCARIPVLNGAEAANTQPNCKTADSCGCQQRRQNPQVASHLYCGLSYSKLVKIRRSVLSRPPIQSLNRLDWGGIARSNHESDPPRTAKFTRVQTTNSRIQLKERRRIGPESL